MKATASWVNSYRGVPDQTDKWIGTGHQYWQKKAKSTSERPTWKNANPAPRSNF